MSTDDLIKELTNPETRRRAVWALGVLGDRRATKELCQMLEQETNLNFRAEIADALRKANDPKAEASLIQFTEDLCRMLEQEIPFEVKLEVVEELGKTQDYRVEGPLIRVVCEKLSPVWIAEEMGCYDGSCRIKAVAIDSLGKLGSTKSLLLMQYGLYHKFYSVQYASVNALANIAKLYPNNIEQVKQIAQVLINKLLCAPPDNLNGRKTTESSFSLAPTPTEQDTKIYDFSVPNVLPTVLLKIAKDHPEEKELVRDIVKALIWEARERDCHGKEYSWEVHSSATNALSELGKVAQPYLIEALVENENTEVRVGVSSILLDIFRDNADDKYISNELFPYIIFAVRFDSDTALCMGEAIDELVDDCLKKCETSQDIKEFHSALDKAQVLLKEKKLDNQDTKQFVKQYKGKADEREKSLEKATDKTPVLDGTFHKKTKKPKRKISKCRI